MLGQSNAEHYSVWENFEHELLHEGYLVYLVHAAQGSSRLVAAPQDWMPPHGQSYQRAVDIYLTQQSPTIDFVIWHQGEGDAAYLKGDWGSSYTNGFETLVKKLDEVILGEWMLLAGSIPIGDYASEQAISEINLVLANNDDVDAFVDFSDIPLKDALHFSDRPEMGRRWAQNVLSLIQVAQEFHGQNRE